jgi:hypothetical protein
MTAIAWIISALSFLGGLAVQADMHGAQADMLAKGLFAASVFSCPVIWDNAMAKQLLTGKERAMACLALMLSLPLVLLH